MLDFNSSTYKKVLEIAIKHNVIANCREYPSLFLNRKRINYNIIKERLKKNLADENFSCGLYVHFPYCKSRCTFCKYYSELGGDINKFNEYLDALEKEICMYGIDFKVKEFSNFFLGGGTPTLMDGKTMERYLNIIFKYFRFKENSQITIEGTPESVSYEKMKQYKRLGISRISIGLQSSNNSVLRTIGRCHQAQEVFRAFEVVRRVGIKYIGTEVIWGLPGETKKTYQKTAKDVLKLQPDFIEGYLLTEGGRTKIKRYYPADITLDRAISDFKEKMLSNGYRIYYSSNFLGFIKEGVSNSKAMNQNTDGLYNYYSDVLGIGAGASSHFRDYKYKTISNIKEYLHNINTGRPPAIYGMPISNDDYKRHYIILQIGFYRSIKKKRYQELFGKSLDTDFPEEIGLLKRKKIVIETKNEFRWRLGEHELGHKSFFMHVIQYWYDPKYVRYILKNCL